MITRNLSVNDAGKMLEAFRSVQVARGDMADREYGFYDYPLTLEDFRERLHDGRMSIALEEGKQRRLVAYVLAFPFYQVGEMDIRHDLALSRVSADPEAIYLDQVFMAPGLPLHIAGRLIDTWTTLAQGYTRQGIVTAIPQMPWKNVPSTRFAIARGFKREGSVRKGELELGVFTKPFWELGDMVKDLKVEIRSAK